MNMMTLNTKHSYKLYVKRATRRVRRQKQQQQQHKRSFKPIMKFKLSQKLQILKNLIPTHNNEETVKPDKLFQETADYIVLLRTQVVILQKLIEFYGNNHVDENALLL
ncbi:putative myc-type, basic helix-loop-helix (bHLH) domain-containing protein [Lupinus albus]|uniref:Putative myc-type, basic helix-loop-helix (BHLH) domain-containing protein n=1 Tax=Lupinus albus TaxID=3870 RepID=A0A6A4QGJ4_LUPAL|nr:putative myc-type, basic helix-loop-helix (bHLH) domain-containing protein [Lupinus albus]